MRILTSGRSIDTLCDLGGCRRGICDWKPARVGFELARLLLGGRQGGSA
jgi:hypothetical protein